MAVTDEIVDFYSSILNGTLEHFASVAGPEPIDVLVRPALEKVSADHTFLQVSKVEGGKLVAGEISADAEVIKEGFSELLKAMADSLSYVFGSETVIRKAREIYAEVAAKNEKLIEDARLDRALPAFLAEEIWEEV